MTDFVLLVNCNKVGINPLLLVHCRDITVLTPEPLRHMVDT